MSDTEYRKLTDLKVVELRAELEKRGLDKNGIKSALLERLQKALEEEGIDPDTYLSQSSCKTPSKNQPKPTPLKEEEQGVPAKTEASAENELANEEQLQIVEEDEEPQTENAKPTEEKSSTADKDNDKKSDDPKEANEELVKTEEKVAKEGPPKDDPKVDPKEGNPDQDTTTITLTLDEGETFHDDEAESQDNEKTVTSEPSDTKNDARSAEAEGESAKEEAATATPKKDEKTTGQNASDKTAGKAKKPVSAAQNRNLWITNISKTTKATELKQALSEYGKVIGAKVVINARFPGTCCYGYVTMDTVEDADNCIAKLNNTELNGQIIKIEKVRPDHMNLKMQNRKPEMKEKPKTAESPKVEKKPENNVEKKEVKKEAGKDEKSDKHSTEKRNGKPDDKKPELGDKKRSSRSQERGRDRTRKSTSRETHDRSLSSKRRAEKKDKDVLTFDKIKEEREKQRMREQERILREESRRRRQEAIRQSEIERRQRSEAQRLAREREKLQLEREKLEREKAELIRLERERQKLEREKLELEKLEIQRAKMRLQEEDRRAIKRSAPFRRDEPYEDRKRSVSDKHYDEAPPPPRFDPPASTRIEPVSPKKFGSSGGKDFKPRMFEKHDSYSSKRDRDYDQDRSHQAPIPRAPPTVISKYENSNVFNLGRERDDREIRGRDNASTVSGSRMSKDSRYSDRERERSPHFRGVRDDGHRRSIPDHKADMRSSRGDHRYSEPAKDPGRFDRSGGGGGWGHPSTSNKVFNSSSSSAPSKPWAKDWRPSNDSGGGSDRWASSNPRGGSGMSGGAFSNSSNMNMGPTCPPPPGLNNYPSDRYDYKNMSSNMRKY